MKLTKLEAEMYQRLTIDRIQWRWTTLQETRTLNRLAKKGYAKYDAEEGEWVKTEKLEAVV